MRQLVVCCDGTWQDVAQLSNVSRLRTAIVSPRGHPEPRYIQGVGVSRNPIDALRGGLTGAGLATDVRNGYRWLVEQFMRGDRVAVFGFSRGAYTARSLAGMVGRVGLVDGSGLGEAGIRDAVDRAFARYRGMRTVPEDPSWDNGLEFVYRPGEPDIPVNFVGVWDTVGALGIPAYVGVPDILRSRERYEFLDVVLNPYIEHARQAVALDEMRGPFRPTLWQDIAPGQDVQQVWFPGDHGDVGGGYRDKGLSDGALDWMMGEATAAIGLTFDRRRIPGFAPDPAGKLHGLRGGPVGAALEVALQPRPRGVPPVDSSRPRPDVAPSAYDRQRSVGYRTTRVLARPGETAEVSVAGNAAWTATGLYFEKGTYRFDARGEWSSAWRSCGPAGESAGWPLSGGSFSRILGVAESVLRTIVSNPEARLPGARREPTRPWMSVMGLVANEGGAASGDPIEADQIFIGGGATARVERPGYFYAFPNDSWGFYGNNSGTMGLTVTRC